MVFAADGGSSDVPQAALLGLDRLRLLSSSFVVRSSKTAEVDAASLVAHSHQRPSAYGL